MSFLEKFNLKIVFIIYLSLIILPIKSQFLDIKKLWDDSKEKNKIDTYNELFK